MARNPRITKAMRQAVLDNLPALLSATSEAELEVAIDNMLQSIIGADDYTTRWCIVTQDKVKNMYVFGPYATSPSAVKAAESGHLASSEATIAVVLPLVPAPKIPKAGKNDTPMVSA